ncbi:Uncharacterised protein [Mycobacteroides abscessus subsp. abscessus]|nr:Uncharacterised protein [Mycobacteroides abscessus subsp. abscessus]
MPLVLENRYVAIDHEPLAVEPVRGVLVAVRQARIVDRFRPGLVCPIVVSPPHDVPRIPCEYQRSEIAPRGSPGPMQQRIPLAGYFRHG